MFKKLRNYFTQKKQVRELTLDTLQKINHMAAAASAVTDAASSMVSTFDTEAINALMENIRKIADDPKLTTAYYQQVSRQAHEQKMAEKHKSEKEAISI